MTNAIKDWLPIKTCNRVALGVAAVAVMIFVICNFLPYYEYPRNHRSICIFSYSGYVPYGYTSGFLPEYRCLFFKELWSDVFNLSKYTSLLSSPDMGGFLSVLSDLAFLMNSLIMLAIVPLWRILHASSYIRIPLAASNFYFAYLAFRISIVCQQCNAPVSTSTIFMLIGIATASAGASLIIFENELELRHELEIKKSMGR